MLHFDHLNILDTHIDFLQKKFKKQTTLFLVGGCIRDLLLGTDKSPIDIDFTMAGNPEAIYKNINTTGLSHFITEKFGTITLIQAIKSVKSKACKVNNNKNDMTGGPSPIKYELTPLRTETGYADFRHPGEITWSNDILLDSERRDFTINCMYYTRAPHKIEYDQIAIGKTIYPYNDNKLLLKKLESHGCIFVKEMNLLIVQSHKSITQLFPQGNIQIKEILPVITNAAIFSIGKKKLKGKKENVTMPLRIIIDPQQGINGCVMKKLTAVGNPDKRFTEDALRIIRALRFVNVINEKLKNGKKPSKIPLSSGQLPLQKETKKGEKMVDKTTLFDFEKTTRNSIKKNHILITHIAKERIKEEIMKAFTLGNPFGFVALLDEAQLLEHLFPALYKTKNVDQPIRYHPFDIYTHTLLTLFELQKINANPLVRLSMLYHDVGKVEQFGAYGENLTKEEIRAIISGPLNHRRSSPEYAKTDFKALGFSSKEITDITWYIGHHHTPEEMIFAKDENKEKKVRSFFSVAGYEKAMNVLDIAMADRLGQYNPLQNSSDLSDVDEIKTILKKLQKEEGQFTMKDLAINGADIIKELELSAGPTIGKLLQKTLAWVMSDIKIRNTKKEIVGFLKLQLSHLKTMNNE